MTNPRFLLVHLSGVTDRLLLDLQILTNTFFKFVQGIARLQRHQQIVDEVKLALKPFYIQGKITKDDYKLIMKKSVEKVCEMFVLEDHLLKLKQN